MEKDGADKTAAVPKTTKIEVPFLASPETKARLQMVTPRSLTEETYKEMWMLRYQQHIGQITFLELLDKYEEILGISPRSESG